MISPGFTNNLIVSVQYISVKLPFPLGRNLQMITSGSNSQPCSQWQLHLCSLILKAFPTRVFTAPLQNGHSNPTSQIRKPKHRSEAICPLGHSQAPDGAEGWQVTRLPTWPARKVRGGSTVSSQCLTETMTLTSSQVRRAVL